jgi:hypothetical protein
MSINEAQRRARAAFVKEWNREAGCWAALKAESAHWPQRPAGRDGAAPMRCVAETGQRRQRTHGLCRGPLSIALTATA